MKRAAVIGAGTMGNGIAHVFAQHEWDVTLIDTAAGALERATSTIRGNVERHRLQDPAKWVPFGVGAIEGRAVPGEAAAAVGAGTLMNAHLTSYPRSQ